LPTESTVFRTLKSSKMTGNRTNAHNISVRIFSKLLGVHQFLGSLITEDGEYAGIPLNRGQAIGASLQKIRKSRSVPISTKIQLGLMKAL